MTALEEGLLFLREEFEAHNLAVMLVPQRDPPNPGACLRVAVSRNATWYRRFCARHPSSRRRRNLCPDTCIRRREISRLLARLLAGLPCRSKYADELLALARRRGAGLAA